MVHPDSPSFQPPPEVLRGRRIIVGLSGGVDSAVAALLLKDQGADVHALHMTNWEDDDAYCTAAADLQDARRVCEQLDIPLHHVNFARQYRERVFEYFLHEYRAGRTPNPDVLCNREIKFGVFRTHAGRLGAEWLATGHYARIRRGSSRGETTVQLWKAADRNKDQSYFLHAVTEEALAETLFPLGELTKEQVRCLAQDRGLNVFDKKDSTGICFIGERPFREFLAQYLPARPGPIRTPEGKTIGEHGGLMYYTPGQRQGLRIGGRKDSSELPWYVAAKDLASNALIVVQGEHPLLYSDELQATDVAWIGETPAALSSAKRLSCRAKVRYRQQDQACRVRSSGDRGLLVSFEKPQRAVAPGQFVVFYEGDRCLGGAVIDRVLSPAADVAREAAI
ncbi:MAG TPA: tRNA 2-thiouridine(34) synthase MnmA [Woeseiaceae bacterium]|nr:tRNA 2-thiouridine(34) synthase MnmA [Woeseiaceae bacterium]